MEDNSLKECISFFKSNNGYKRLMEGAYKKYRSLGTLGGTVVLKNLTFEEKDALSGLLRKDYYSSKSASIKLENVKKMLDESKFQGIPLEDVVEGYFKRELISKKDEKSRYEAERQSFFDSIADSFKYTRAGSCFGQLIDSRSNAFKLICSLYDKDKNMMKSTMSSVLNALNALSFDTSNPSRLAIFSSSITKNPHFFDWGTEGSRLLLYGVCRILGDTPYPKSAEERTEVLYRAGLITDEISNYTMTSGLIAYSDNLIHDGWLGFYNSKEPLLATLWNISKISRVTSPTGKVFVFENPTVFSHVKTFMESDNPPLVCTFGQVKLASLILLDKLVDEGCLIYYSGDFDPEGLLIADKLKMRYGSNLVLWRYTQDDFMNALSGNPVEAHRLKILQGLRDSSLIKLGESILSCGRAGYQELLAERYAEDIGLLINS